MKKALFFLFFPLFIFGQSYSLYDPQTLYELPGSLYDVDSLKTLKITFYDPNYNQTLDASYYNNPDFRLPAQVLLDSIHLDSVAIRYKGNSTYTKCNSSIKKPYNIDFNDIVSGQKLMAKKKMKLSNSWFDPTFLKELMASRIYKRYLPSYEVNLMRVFTQGTYTGLYSNQEAINKQFLEKHFGEKDGVLIKCDPINMALYSPNLQYLGADTSLYYNSYELKSNHGWEQLMELTDVLNNTPSNIESILNVDRVLWYFAVNQSLLNHDSYNVTMIHNYYLYKSEDGLFQIIPWDLSESFINAFWGSFPNTNNDPYQIQANSPLVDALLNNPLYRKTYTAHLKTIANESLDTTWYSSEISSLQSLAYNSVISDTEKGYSDQDFYTNLYQPSSLNQWTTAAPFLPVIEDRRTYLLNHAEISMSSPSINNLSVQEDKVMVEVANANNVELMATISTYNSNFQSIPMLDNGTSGDLVSGDGIYTASLPWSYGGNQVKFYIRAQNNEALSLLPQRAEYEFYEYNMPLGVEESSLASNYIVSPNPTNLFVKIQGEVFENTNYGIYSLMGKLLKSGLISPSQKRIDFSGLPNNLYLLKLNNQTYKILKN